MLGLFCYNILVFDVINEIGSQISPEFAGPQYDTASDLSAIAINFVIGIGFSFGFVSLAYGFILYILSKGDPKQTQRAFNAALYGAIASFAALGLVFARGQVLNALGVTEVGILQPLPDF